MQHVVCGFLSSDWLLTESLSGIQSSSLRETGIHKENNQQTTFGNIFSDSFKKTGFDKKEITLISSNIKALKALVGRLSL